MTGPDIHAVLIGIHATAAVLALAATVAAFRFPAVVAAHLVGVLVMTVALAGAELVGFASYPGVLKVVFPGLLVLAVFMCTRAHAAWRARPGGPGEDRVAYIDALGFTTISLVVGFLAITAVRMELGALAVATAVVVPILVGRIMVARALRARP